MSRKIIIEIDQDARITIDAVGFKDHACEEHLKEYLALAKVSKEALKALNSEEEGQTEQRETQKERI